VPKLVKDGFKGKIFSTRETKEIAELMLQDGAKIGDRNLQETGEMPLYGMADVNKTMTLWQTVDYHKPLELEGFSVTGFDSGHILGSIMFVFSFEGKKMLFTGDLGNSPAPLLKDREVVSSVDYILMDSVYGDRRHENKEERIELLKEAVEKVSARGGTLLIPSFALDRTQVILYELDNMFEQKLLKPIPVFLDSPLAIKITDIYKRLDSQYKDSVQSEMKRDHDIFRFPKLVETASVRDSKEIVGVHGPKIIIAGSGMSTAGRIVGHEKFYLPDPNNMILFIGYQAPGTLGRQIVDGIKEVNADDARIKVRAEVVSIDGFSGHADTDALLSFVESAGKGVKNVFVAMGEPKASIFLAQRIQDELNIKALVPELYKTYEL
jgi:metallo-beta-lactamase family protein